MMAAIQQNNRSVLDFLLERKNMRPEDCSLESGITLLHTATRLRNGELDDDQSPLPPLTKTVQASATVTTNT
ncbi:hypothetical protein DFR30_2657 [Thiogranum longum]|uniref:Ankyrin repeat protein n=1 Tax=Thiogranum longum TaxID=1537524 RepID=A0A4R1HBJ9_9GAMM|nr:hypothetical protein DFR30_2657 [Thiogranum longum]